MSILKRYDVATSGWIPVAVGAPGQYGATGASGLSGATGATGIAGATGVSGINGATGIAGATGFTGATGNIGATGLNGATGVAGIAGATGFTGTTGFTGATGNIGATGLNGATGVAGINGATGIAGATGVSGVNGATGISGATGFTGATGNIGATGLNGATGLTGDTGSSFAIAIFQDRQSPATAGQAYTANTFTTQRLNTDVINNIPGVSRSADTITLPSGNYYVDATISVFAANNVSSHSILKTTGGTVLVVGIPASYGTTGGGHGINHLKGYFEVTSETSVNLQIWMNIAIATSNPNSGQDKVYASITLIKI